MDAGIRPKGILDFLSQQEICQLVLRKTENLMYRHIVDSSACGFSDTQNITPVTRYS